MPNDLLSGSDAHFHRLLDSLAAHLPAPDPALTAAADAWRAARTAADNAARDAESATAAKTAARKEAIRLARVRIRIVQADPAVSDATRAAMGVPVRDRKPTRIPRPATAPRRIVAPSGRGEHRLTAHADLGDAGFSRRARPRGVAGVEVYVMSPDVGPESPLATYRLLTILTRPGQRVTLPGEFAGKMAWYQARWRNPRGETGPWSERVECTVLA